MKILIKNSQFPVLENELQTFTLHTNVELKNTKQ